jgi:hypothetical protein
LHFMKYGYSFLRPVRLLGAMKRMGYFLLIPTLKVAQFLGLLPCHQLQTDHLRHSKGLCTATIILFVFLFVPSGLFYLLESVSKPASESPVGSGAILVCVIFSNVISITFPVSSRLRLAFHFEQLRTFFKSHVCFSFCRKANWSKNAEIPAAHFDISMRRSGREFFNVLDFCDSLQCGHQLANAVRTQFVADANIHRRAMH